MIPCYTRVISERFRDQFGIIKRYRHGLFTLHGREHALESETGKLKRSWTETTKKAQDRVVGVEWYWRLPLSLEEVTRSLAIAKRLCNCCIILKSGSYTKAI